VATAASEVCAAAEKTAAAVVSDGVVEYVRVAANQTSSHASLRENVAAMLSDVLNVVAMLLLQETDSWTFSLRPTACVKENVSWMLNVGEMQTASEKQHGALLENVAANVNSSPIFFWKESAAWNVNGFADLLCHLLPGISFRKHVLPPPPVHAVKLPPLPSVHPFFWPLSSPPQALK